MTRALPRTIARVVVATALLVAGALKIGNPAEFYKDIVNFRMLPELPSALLAVYLPWFEVVTAIALFVPAVRRGAALCATLLFLMFAVAVGTAWARGLDIECGCFGDALKHGNLAITFAIDVVLVACSLLLLREGGDATARATALV